MWTISKDCFNPYHTIFFFRLERLEGTEVEGVLAQNKFKSKVNKSKFSFFNPLILYVTFLYRLKTDNPRILNKNTEQIQCYYCSRSIIADLWTCPSLLGSWIKSTKTKAKAKNKTLIKSIVLVQNQWRSFFVINKFNFSNFAKTELIHTSPYELYHQVSTSAI